MKKEKEFEAKILISKADFFNIVKTYNINLTKNKKLINHFFDTNDFAIYKNNAVFRVRETAKKLMVTIKKSVKINEMDEFHKNIKQEEFARIKSGLTRKANYGKKIASWGVDVSKVRYQGVLSTHRWEIPYGNSLIVLDHCLYNNKEDWEIECESKSGNKAEKILTKFCLQNKINKTGQKMSKYGRFIFFGLGARE